VCDGKGSEIINPCHDCGGTAVKRDMSTFKIKLPKQVNEGQKIRMNDAGDYNPQIKAHNELIGNIILSPQDNFKIEGKNLFYTKELKLSELKKDPYIIIPHPDGELKIKVPNHGTTKTPLRIKGKGYNPNSSDLFIKIELFLNDLVD
jgi:molecular chaperone DnaJ